MNIKIWDNHNKQWLKPISIYFDKKKQISIINACEIGATPLNDGWYKIEGKDLDKIAIIGEISHNKHLLPISTTPPKINHIDKLIINPFIGGEYKLNFGDYILFQEYKQGKYDGNLYHYNVTKPILAIFLGSFVADQTLGFNYVKWINQNHQIQQNIGGITFKDFKQVDTVEQHIHWNDYIDILGHWTIKPNYKQILNAYRKQNTKLSLTEKEFNLKTNN